MDEVGREITARLDVAELAEGHEERRKAASGVVPRVTVGARTDLGRARENNEDKFDFIEPEDPERLANNGALFAVADGMGGHAAGQIASEMALKSLVKNYYAGISCDVESRLRAAIREANGLVHDTARMTPDRSGMGTTLVVAVVREEDLFVAHVGDSRAYLIRGGAISRLTVDHSWVAEQVARGVLSEEEALRSPFRNVITRSMGVQPSVEPDVTSLKLEEGDRVLLCSDGLTGMLSDEDLLRLAAEGSPSEAALRLVDAANERGGSDNITVVLVRVEGIGEAVEGPRRAVAAVTEEAPPAGWLSKVFRR